MTPAGDGPRPLRRYFACIVLAFVAVFLLLWWLGTLVDGLRGGSGLAFDVPILRALHAMANARLDRAFLLVTGLGYGGGVLPADAILVLALAATRRTREGTFAGVAILGALVLDFAVKHASARARPSLWEALVQESSYSFPSGHAMASMTLASVVVLLCWSDRSRLGRTLRWPATLIASAFVLLVGVSRIYLGLHYPSDVLAGWAAASLWVASVHACTFRGCPGPWRD